MLPGVKATAAKAPAKLRHRRAGTPHPATCRQTPYPASHLMTPPPSPNHQSRQMPLAARLHFMENHQRRFHPDERGTAKEQRKRRATQKKNINLLGGDNGRRLLARFVSTSH